MAIRERIMRTGDKEPSLGWGNPMGWRIGDPAPEGMFGSDAD